MKSFLGSFPVTCYKWKGVFQNPLTLSELVIPISTDEMKQESNDHGVQTFWTGGWDSTFRVLYASLVERRRVDPHYIIDTGRPSSLHELRAISRVKDLLKIRDRHAYERISNLHITSGNEIPEDIEITNSWKRLKCQMEIARQYDWLARYAKSENLTGLELCMERPDVNEEGDAIYSFLKANLEQTPFGTYKVRRSITGDGKIFARFEFPIFEYSKSQMRDIARKHGFIEILEKSWFCHTPINGTPCGMCNPCVYAVKEGMQYRFPRKSLFRYHLVQFVRKSPFSKVKLVRQTYHLMRYGSKG